MMIPLWLDPSEDKLTEVRRHWFVVVSEAIIFFIIAVLPVVIYNFLPIGDLIEFIPGNRNFLFTFLYSAWLLFIWVIFFVFFTDYYLDYWVVTNKRIIDVEQKGLFARDIATVRLDKIEDIKVEVHGIFGTLLHFGDIHVQTAGESREFIMRTIARPYHVRDIIMRHSDRAIERYQNPQT